jgi:hypothetical protein
MSKSGSSFSPSRVDLVRESDDATALSNGGGSVRKDAGEQTQDNGG